MATHMSRLFSSGTIVLSLLCCGCPTPPGGDPAIWHTIDTTGTGEIVSIADAAADGGEISMKWIYSNGKVDEKVIEHVKLADIADLPDGYEAKVGDKLPLKVEIRWKGKASVGPPRFWHDKVDERKITCVGSIDNSGASAAKEDDIEDKSDDDVVGDIAQLIWETTGGGQMEFTVTPDGSDYKIHLNSYSFRDLPLDLPLTADDGKAYEFVKAIFAKEHDIHDNTFTPGGPTGSWTSITLVDTDGNKTKVDNIRAWGELSAIYEFVAAVAKENEPEPEPLPDDEPDPPPILESE